MDLAGIEPAAPENETGMLPLHYPAILEAMLNEVEKRTSGRIGEAAHQTPLEAIPEIHKLVPFPFQLIPAAAHIPERHSAELKVHIQTVR